MIDRQMKYNIRPITLNDVEKVMGVLRDAAFSNILPGVRATYRGNTFKTVTVLILLATNIYSGSVWSTLLSGVLLTALVYLFNVAVAVVYAYGPPLHDMRDVVKNYLSDPMTRFWVLEVYPKERQSDIAGCIAIVKKGACDIEGHTVAWLRRMAVHTEYRGCGFAKALINTAIEFSREQKYDRIDLITTEVHDAARQLYRKMGFQCLGIKLYKYYSGLVHIWTYEYTYILNNSYLHEKTSNVRLKK